jgi:hypothetical protein
MPLYQRPRWPATAPGVADGRPFCGGHRSGWLDHWETDTDEGARRWRVGQVDLSCGARDAPAGSPIDSPLRASAAVVVTMQYPDEATFPLAL